MHRRRIGVIAAGVVAMTAIALAAWVWSPIPPPMLAHQGARAVTILDRNGITLRSTRAADGSQEQWVPYDRIDADVINAFIAVEDRRFWDHHGVDVRAIARAVRDNLNAHRVTSGASTISMQLARVLYPASRSWHGKLAQTMWALRLEATLGKQQILEQYLNRLQLGQGTVGVGAASALYFNSSASELSIAQAATLAGIAHAPSRDNPYVSPRRAAKRRLYALRRLRELRFASRDDIRAASEERIAAPARATPFLAPHFTSRVLAWVAEDSSRVAGDVVGTSLDLGLQQAVEAEVRHTVEMLRDRGVEHAAAVVLDNETGEVRAWVGSPDFWDAKDGQTDMVVSARQPGSALKPFLYGLAMDGGLTAATVIADLPRTYATATGNYSPRNYDRTFRGPVRAREALASSYNVPAVELASRAGAASLLHTLHLAGFASLDRDAEHYGLGLALGNGDVTLIELANGYRALAMGGEWHAWSWRTAGRGTGAGRRVVTPVTSAILLDMLSDPAARIPGFGVNTPFDFPFPVAVKTGTSRHFTDNWAVGTTRGFTVAVWAGNFSGRPMQGVSGVTGAGPLLHRVVMETSKRISAGVFPGPASAGAVAVPVCRLSGMRATSSCAQLTEWFAPGTAPAQPDTWERGGVATLPDEYGAWAHQSARPAASRLASAEAKTDAPPAFRITSPRDGDRYAIPSGVEPRYASIPLRASGGGGVRWSVDGAPFEQDRWIPSVGEHVFRAVSARGEVNAATVVVLP